MSTDLFNCASKALDEILSPRGFKIFVSGDTHSFRDKESDSIHFYVDLHKLDWSESVDVVMQVIESDGTRRMKSLSDFRGLRDYEHAEDEDLGEVVDNISADLMKYGLKWLSGIEIGTEFTLASKSASNDYRFGALISQAKELFRCKNYIKSIESFELASKIESLDGSNLKHYMLAKKRAGED